MGEEDAATECVALLMGGQLKLSRRTVATGVAMAVGTTIGRLWQHGWLPLDVWQFARRQADSEAVDLLADAVVADLSRYAESTVDSRWAAQVASFGSGLWWDRDTPHLVQWTERRGVDFEHALLATITLLATLMGMPELPRILPLPGQASRSAQSVRAVDQKVLDRVRGLLAKAESTEFPEEAEALSAKAQELMNRYAFERALLDADVDRKPTAGSTRMWLDAPYVEAKSHLVSSIASANRCRAVFYGELGFVALVGEQLDLEITELLATSLLVQATRAMVAEGSRKNSFGGSRTRSFRQSFLVSYAMRVGERLEEAGVRSHDPAEDKRLLPVLAARSRVVDETFEEMFQHTVRRSVSVTDGEGWLAGRGAADRADLTVDRPRVSR
jgi:hypothetical protein